MQMCVHPVTAQPFSEHCCQSSAHSQTEEDGGWLHPWECPGRKHLLMIHKGPFSGDSARPERTQLLSLIREHRGQAPGPGSTE